MRIAIIEAPPAMPQASVARRRMWSGKILGHSDIEVTMTIYAHASLEEKRRALVMLGNALG